MITSGNLVSVLVKLVSSSLNYFHKMRTWLPNPFRKLFALGFFLSMAGRGELWCLRLEGLSLPSLCQLLLGLVLRGVSPRPRSKLVSRAPGGAVLEASHRLAHATVTWGVSLPFRSNHYIAQ